MTRSVTEPQLQGTASAGTLLTTATAYIHLFTTLDADAFFDLLSPDYEHTFAPDSLHMSGPIDKAQFTEREMNLRAVMSGISLAVKHMWANPSLRQVVVWAHAEAQFDDHLKDINHENGGEEWACRIEYMSYSPWIPVGSR